MQPFKTSSAFGLFFKAKCFQDTLSSHCMHPHFSPLHTRMEVVYWKKGCLLARAQHGSWVEQELWEVHAVKECPQS